MSGGVAITTTSDELRTIQRRLSRLAKLDFTKPLTIIGALIEGQTRKRVQDEKTSPDGVPWRDWLKSYVSKVHGRKKHKPHGTASPAGGHSLLQLDGDLLDSIQYLVSSSEVEIGSNLAYAAAHQFGYPEGEIPERPYLGVSEDNEREILDVMEEWFETQIEGLIR